MSLQQQNPSNLSSKADEIRIGDLETALTKMKLPAHGDVALESKI